MIRFETLVLGYDKPMIQVNIEGLKTNTIYGLIGSNGSGKSTFLKTLAGQCNAFSGDFFIGEKKSTLFDRTEWAYSVAFVPPQCPKIEFMNVFQFIALGRTPYFYAFGRINSKDQKIIQNVMQIVEIEHLQNTYINLLSDGQRQLCAIARSLVQQTPIILLDEPTGFLDYRNKRKIISLLKKIAQTMNKCILFSSHDIETIAHLNIPLIGIRTSTSINTLEWIDPKIPFSTLIERYYDPL